MFQKLGRAGFYPMPLRVAFFKKVLQQLRWVSYPTRLQYDALTRPHYGFCIYNAALLANSLEVPKISAIEFGVAGGRGLINIEYHVDQIRKLSLVDFEIYGFDLESGLPDPKDYRDMPYMWKEGFYSMDRERLEGMLKYSKLVVGDVQETCSTFLEEYNPAPIGCALFDLDYYSSTTDAFKIFDTDPNNYLPRVYCYFDDIFSGGPRAINEFVGVPRAIKDFNQQHRDKKIARIEGLAGSRKVPTLWNEQIFVFHDFSHPQYCNFTGNHHQNLVL